MSERWWKKKRFLGLGAGLLVVAVALVGAQAAMAEEYRVVRVVDGDTVDVRSGLWSTTRVRLLNVDAPESVDPSRPVECLGPEASQRLSELLPEGTPVDLAFDVERSDRYGRTLAGVYANGALVNAQLASEGLAVPATVGVNNRFRAEVDVAWQAASDQQLGLLGPNARCTAPGQVQNLKWQVATLAESSAPQQASDAAAAASVAKAVTEDASTMQKYLLARSAFEVAALPRSVLSPLVQDVAALVTQSTAMYKALVKKEASLKAEEKTRADAKARAEARAKAKAKARAKAKEEARAKAEAEAEALRNESTDADDSSSGGDSGADSGYTGPRCYAPGGKTWRPC
jgi:micrococcal nuclease